jgi:NAD(P)-dependent dehydrogenase (short-subunit alcohol dehydrogenase family)
MDLHLSGKTAVVTGASKDIGLAITRALVDAGAYVVAGSRTRGTELEGLEDTDHVKFVPADLATPQAPATWSPPPRTAAVLMCWSITPGR